MAVAVVDVFKIVRVQHQQKQRGILPRAAQLVGKIAHHLLTVIHLGERVDGDALIKDVQVNHQQGHGIAHAQGGHLPQINHLQEHKAQWQQHERGQGQQLHAALKVLFLKSLAQRLGRCEQHIGKGQPQLPQMQRAAQIAIIFVNAEYPASAAGGDGNADEPQRGQQDKPGIALPAAGPSALADLGIHKPEIAPQRASGEIQAINQIVERNWRGGMVVVNNSPHQIA